MPVMASMDLVGLLVESVAVPAAVEGEGEADDSSSVSLSPLASCASRVEEEEEEEVVMVVGGG